MYTNNLIIFSTQQIHPASYILYLFVKQRFKLNRKSTCVPGGPAMRRLTYSIVLAFNCTLSIACTISPSEKYVCLHMTNMYMETQRRSKRGSEKKRVKRTTDKPRERDTYKHMKRERLKEREKASRRARVGTEERG